MSYKLLIYNTDVDLLIQVQKCKPPMLGLEQMLKKHIKT